MWNERMWGNSWRRQAGLTLVELIVAMVIIGVAVAGMVAAFTRADRASVDPVIHKQLASVAEGIMEEILLKPFDAAANNGNGRANFNDVRDFHGLNLNGVTTVNGDPVPGLEQVRVEVAISDVTLSDSTTALQIVVTVRRGADEFTLTGWRTDYA